MMVSHALATVKHHLKCPYCGSKDLALDPRNGLLVCRSCGYVVDDYVIDYSGQVYNVEVRSTDVVVKGGRTARLAIALVEARNEAKLAAILGADSPLFREISPNLSGDLIRMIKTNKCIRKLVSKLPANEAAALLHAAYMLANNEYPLPAHLASTYKMHRNRVRALIRKAAYCLDLEPILG